LLVVISCLVYGQTVEKPLTFDVASIKPNASAPAGGRAGPAGGTVRITQGTVVGRGATARRIIQAAYRLSEYQVSGGPSWLGNDTFDLNAKANAPANADQVRQMLQTLLAERFKLAVHRGAREMPVYALTLGKSGLGPNLHPMEEGREPTIPREERWGSRTGREGPYVVLRGRLSDIAFALTGDLFGGALGRPVVDKSGVEGMYIGYLHWVEVEGRPGTPTATILFPRCKTSSDLSWNRRKRQWTFSLSTTSKNRMRTKRFFAPRQAYTNRAVVGELEDRHRVRPIVAPTNDT
jgi:uncharacterized protein (TIGR03435 family)